MGSRKIKAELILATLPVDGISLYTFQVEVPYYIWTELLTHKRFARNASSNRAMSVKRNIEELGYYLPPFYKSGKGMKAGEPVDLFSELDSHCLSIWEGVWDYCTKAALALEANGIAKEQSSRVLPTFKMMRGLLTGTLPAWLEFLSLRDNADADTAMQELAKQIRKLIHNATPVRSYYHVPFSDGVEHTQRGIYICGGRIARLSYGKTDSKDNDHELGIRLVEKGHMSPFEHIAVWEYNSLTSCLCSKPSDKVEINDHTYYGWENARSILEKEFNLLSFYRREDYEA